MLDGSDWVSIAVAVFGVGGTVFGVSVGYRQWRRDRADKKSEPFRNERREAYKELWSKVELLNIFLRTDSVAAKDFSSEVTELNAFMLLHGVYVDDSDRQLVNEYVRAVFEFQGAVRGSDDERARVALGETWVIPPETLKRVETVRRSHEVVQTLRDRFAEKTRSVLGDDVAKADGQRAT